MPKCITQQGFHLAVSVWLSLPVRSSSDPSLVFLTCSLLRQSTSLLVNLKL